MTASRARADSVTGEGVLTSPGAGVHVGVSAAAEAAEGGQERLAEIPVHEAVGNGVAARRHVRQQVQQRLDDGADVAPGAGPVEDDPGTQHVGGRPEDEELHHDHEQHLDHALLGGAGLVAVGLADGALRLQPPERPRHRARRRRRLVRVEARVVVAGAGAGRAGGEVGGGGSGGDGAGGVPSPAVQLEGDSVVSVVGGGPAALTSSF